jgi:hypothetical protein
VVALRQGVRDDKMLEKLATHDIQDVMELFSLVDKCARVAEGHAWHTSPAPGAGQDSKPDVQGGNNNKNKKKKKGGDNSQLLASASTAIATAAAVAGEG